MDVKDSREGMDHSSSGKRIIVGRRIIILE
jgi:hypothetical protein